VAWAGGFSLSLSFHSYPSRIPQVVMRRGGWEEGGEGEYIRSRDDLIMQTRRCVCVCAGLHRDWMNVCFFLILLKKERKKKKEI
jgi:hypothetical protein